MKNHEQQFCKLNDCAFVWFRLIVSGAFNAFQVLKAVWIVLCLDNCKSLEHLKVDLGSHGSFLETIRALSKNIMIEDRDGGHWKHPDPDATSHAADAATSFDNPPRECIIEWENSACRRAT